jgi:hypothetical protein
MSARAMERQLRMLGGFARFVPGVAVVQKNELDHGQLPVSTLLMFRVMLLKRRRPEDLYQPGRCKGHQKDVGRE